MLFLYNIGSTLLIASGVLSLSSVIFTWIKEKHKIPKMVILCTSCFSSIIILVLTLFTDVPNVIGMSCDNAKQWLSSKGLSVVCINQEDMQPETDLSMPVRAQSSSNCVLKKGEMITLYTRQETKEIVNKSIGNQYANSHSQYYTPGKKYSIGDKLLFGTFEQDGLSDNGKELIEWTVISVTGDKILVITEYGLAYMKYQASNEGPTWEKSSLREWLNSSFYFDAFTNEEKSYIAETKNTNIANPSYFTDGGKATPDWLFCLSVYEAIKYFDSDVDRIAVPTKYAIDTAAGRIHTDGDYWWLRTPGNTDNEVMNVRGNGSSSGVAGSINFFGSKRFGDEVMIRPAMWLLSEPTY